MAKESVSALHSRVERVLPDLGDGPVAAWDIDSTLANTAHRRHVSQAVMRGEATWGEYAMRCLDDEPVEGSVALMRELSKAGYSHVAVSGRSDCAWALTWEWFDRHEVPVNAVLLRKDGDYRPNGDYKVAVLRTLQAWGVDVRLFFEDWGKVAEQVRQETGIPVVGINPFDSEEMSSLGQGL